jgi:two-component system, OmpR family, phosphate regulon sensor histidine kinase PhoR
MMPDQNNTEVIDLIQHLPQAVVVMGRSGNITSFSPAAATLFPALKLDSPLSFVIRDPELLDMVRLTADDGQARKLEIFERIPVQRFFSVDVVKADLIGILIAFEDLSASRKLEQMRVDFIANASHELRTPLASLLGFIETLKGPAKKDPAAQTKFLEIMEAQAKRMARLIDDLLSLSRIELHAHILPNQIVPLLGVIQQIRDALAPVAAEKSTVINIHSDVPDMTIRGDRDELLRLFENLIENAIKYGTTGKPIDITMHRVGDKVEVIVRDYGAGIAPEDIPRLTERFYRVNPAKSREVGGTGLGLAIVKHIVARHRGKLDISSVLGEGSSFRITLDVPA